MDFLNSPLVLVVFCAGLAAFLWFRNRAAKRQKCRYCGKGTMQEMEVIPEKIMQTQDIQAYHTPAVRMKVKYQCTNCKEFLVTVESRR